MLQGFIITSREGVEAFLIVAVSLAFLRKANRHDLVRALYCGLWASALVSIAAALLFRQASNAALWEGVLSLAAAVLVAPLVVHMWRNGKRLKHQIEELLRASAGRGGARAFWGVFAFTVFMVSREGMETVLLLGAVFFQVRSFEVAAGACAGLLCAGAIALLWGSYGHRVNLGKFLQATAVFLLLFLVQLLIYGFHELAEAGVLPYHEAIHEATEPYGPDGLYGRHLSYLLVLAPLGWLAATSWRNRVTAPAS